ncbi:glycoside hydrolase family 30 protein [Methylomonas rapida]|uniref:Glucosylceramidase n=1 Tax=Methylomonas rapida TaxID=2963939 RepID=A0ABY7GFV2_9GAMM|nr:glycoside hydrolase family 30 beta sandwich domain-containing protein [Methylomonas rapida]WAR43714.1 glucosylceramidase [Methylomonas rapida]
MTHAIPLEDSMIQMDRPVPLAVWLTSADQNFLLERQPAAPCFGRSMPDLPSISVDATRRYQVMEGFGFSLTGGSAMLISRLPADTRQALLGELFLPDGDGIGVSFLRLSIGASDLSERSFSYDDMPDGDSDFDLAYFDIEAGDIEIIPLLQDILQLNPDLKIIATPWSAPRWMKTNRAFVGGRLKAECYPVYAAYLVKYLLAMRERGIVIHAITPQNEPQNFKNDPSMVMEALEQADFIKNHLGPALTEAGLNDVEVFCWDHNCDAPEYPLAVFADAEARRYLSGSAWHLYGGDISVLSEIHKAYPDLKLYFTEQWVGSDGQFGGDLIWHSKNVLIGAARNWSQVVLEWNLASDPFCQPHTLGGESRCVGALTLDGDQVTRNVAYYIIAHAAKWVRPGSVRIHSDAAVLPNVAFLTPEGLAVLIVLNDGAEAQSFNIRFADQSAITTLPANTVATYVWPATQRVGEDRWQALMQ